MDLIFGFLNGSWDNYLRAIQTDPSSVVVPLSRQWQTDANQFRRHAETRIRVKRGGSAVIANTINHVKFVGEDAVMFFLSMAIDTTNPAHSTNRTELTALGNNCFANRIILTLLPGENTRHSQRRIAQMCNSVMHFWQQIGSCGNFHYRPSRPQQVFQVPRQPPRPRT